MSFYSELADMALELLTEFGAPVTRRAVTTGAYDPATGAAAQTTADTTRQGALFPFMEDQTTLRGQLIQAGDKRLLLDAAGGLEPPDLVLASDGAVYSIVSFEELAPAGTVLLYDAHVRIGG